VELLTTGIATYYVTGHTYVFHNRSETELHVLHYKLHVRFPWRIK